MTLPEADADAKAARSWYGAVRSELGEQFVWAIDAAVQAIRAKPLAFSLWSTVIGGVQACGAFPTDYLSSCRRDRIVVIACFHARSNPQRWQIR